MGCYFKVKRSLEGLKTMEPLEKRMNQFYQRGTVVMRGTEHLDYRSEETDKPFAINYFKLPSELPLDWQMSGETGTQGSIYQKDD